jgi:hypothetical protein
MALKGYCSSYYPFFDANLPKALELGGLMNGKAD